MKDSEQGDAFKSSIATFTQNMPVSSSDRTADNTTKNHKTPVLSKLKLKHIVASILVIVTLISLIAVAFIGQKNMTQSNIVPPANESLVSTSVPTTITTLPTRDLHAKPEQKSWHLKKTNNRTSSIEFSLCSWCGSYLMQWKDWLFYPDPEDSSTQINNIQIKGYNLKTNKTLIIYDVSKNTGDFLEYPSKLPYQISDMQIIEDTLFFSLGGYLTSGGIFSVALPPVAKPIKFYDQINARITHWKNRYWIIGGVGDGCWSFTSYSLLDVATKKVSHIADSHSGCSQGEEYVGIDKRDRMILAFHVWNPASPTDESGKLRHMYYKSVTAVPLYNPTVKEMIIANQDMPKNITEIYYLEEIDQLFLRGNENYIFDFSSNTLKKNNQIPLIPKKLSLQTNNKSFKEIVKEINLPPQYEFVFE